MNRFRKISSISLISVLLFAALLVIFHFWLIRHAKSILSGIVSTQSKGKYHLEVGKIKYDYLKLRLELYHPVLSCVDTDSSGDKFEMHTPLILLQLEKLWPLISGRHLLIDSILLDRPQLELIHQKRSDYQSPKTAFNLSVEMEKLYQSIESVLTRLKVNNFRIINGSVSLNSGFQKNKIPLQVKGIDFYIKGFNIDSATISQHPHSYTEDVQLKLSGQTIHFPDGNRSIQFSSFRLVANKGNLEVDSCTISGGDNDSTKASFQLYAEKMRIKNVFLAANDSTDYNRIDSIFFTSPKVSFTVQMKDAQQDSLETIAKAITKITSAAFGRILVRHASVNNVNFDVVVERKEKLSTFNFVQDSLVISNLGVGLFPSMPLSASSIRFGVKEFVDYFRDSTYLVRFDSVRINNDQFSLFNINIESTAKVKKGHQKIFIPILQIQGIDWYRLISQKKLVASNFTMYDPFISIIAAHDAKNRKPKTNGNLEGLLRQMFVLKYINVINGSVHYAFSGDEFIQVRKINTSITPDDPPSGLIAALQNMIRNLNTGELEYRKDGWRMTATNINYGIQNTFSAARINLTNNLQNLHINADKVSLSGLSGETKHQSPDIKKITWENANIILDLSNKQPAKASSPLHIAALNGGATSLKIVNNNVVINAKVTKIVTGDIIVENGKPKALRDVMTEGAYIDIVADSSKFHSEKFIIKDRLPSSLSSVTASFRVNDRAISISIPRVEFEPDIQRSVMSPIEIGALSVLQPRMVVNRVSSTGEGVSAINKQKKFPEINLKNLAIIDPVIDFKNNTEDEPLQLMPGSSSIVASGIKTSDNGRQLTFSDLQIQSKSFALADKDSLRIFSSNGTVVLRSKAFTLFSGTTANSANWEVNSGSIDLSNLNLLNKRLSGAADTLQLFSFHAGNVSLTDRDLKSPSDYFAGQPAATLDNVHLSYKNNNSRFAIHGLKGNTRYLSLDSFSYHPQVSAFDFILAQAFQRDYITFESGQVFLEDINMFSWLKDSVLRVGQIHISDAVLDATRDKYLPLEPGIIKGLPVTILKNLPVRTLVDSVSISNSMVSYHEVGEKTRQTGTIRFTRLKAIIRNVKNFGYLIDDSLQALASAYMMDTTFIQLKMKESYTDSLASFPITVKVRPFDMKILNPFLLPVLSARIKSGISDSLQFRAIGREYVSVGEMLFLYHDLRVEFLKAASDQKKTLLTSLITFAANSFVIRTKNKNRVGKIFYERSRNRSFFNYLVKMLGSGVASSVGAKRNQKYNRLYNDKIRELRLPAIDYQD